MMEWLSQFAAGFSPNDPSEPYRYREQSDIANQFYENQNAQNGEQTKNDDVADFDEHRQNGESEKSGEKFEVKIKSNKKKNVFEDTIEGWKEAEKEMSFSSLDNKNKTLNSSLKNLCGGAYAHLNNLPNDAVANILAKDYDKIFNYVNASIAGHSDAISVEQAIELANSVAEDGKISSVDYGKLKGKLRASSAEEFDMMLKSAFIEVSTGSSKVASIKGSIDDHGTYPLSSFDIKESNYYFDYIKSFAEYKTENHNGLTKRIASVWSGLNEAEKKDLMIEMKKDKVMSRLFAETK